MTPEMRPLPTLPLHLSLAVSEWLSSTIACACLKSGSLRWKRMSENLQSHDALQLQRAVHAEAKARLSALLSGVKRYQEIPYVRELAEPPVIWRKGNARLLDYTVLAPALKHRTPLLLIPSLINRYYILDLDKKRSLARYLAQQGIPTLLLDWGAPGALEEGFDCAGYVTRMLAESAFFITSTAGKKLVAGGYCMGGVLATGLAAARPMQVEGLALFAAPWDFSVPDMQPHGLSEAFITRCEQWLAEEKIIPPEWIQMLFTLRNPFSFQQKFRRFAALPEQSPACPEFMALESWVNDGVPMTAGVAKDCLLDWAQRNVLARNLWQIEHINITPSRLQLPAFLAIPENDQIVPEACALPLARQLRHAAVIHPSCGHVGMMVGSKAKTECWEPFVQWYQQFG